MGAMGEQAMFCIALPLKKDTQKEDVKDTFPQHQHTLAEQCVSTEQVCRFQQCLPSTEALSCF